MSDRTKKWLWLGVRFVISVGALAYIATQTKLSDLVENVRGLRPGLLALAFGIYQVSILLRTLRWRMLLRGHGIRISFLKLLRLVYTGLFFNTFLPSSLSGEVVRTVEVAQEEGQAARQAGIVALEQVLNGASLLVIALASLILNPNLLPPAITRPLLIASIVGLIVIGLLLEGALLRRVESLYQNLPGAEHVDQLLTTITELPRGALLRGAAVAFAFQLVVVTMHFAAARANRIDLGWHYFAAFNPVVGLSVVVPSFQGLGVREQLYTWLLKGADVAGSKAVTLGLTIYAIALVTGLIGGLINLLTSVSDVVNGAGGEGPGTAADRA